MKKKGTITRSQVIGLTQDNFYEVDKTWRTKLLGRKLYPDILAVYPIKRESLPTPEERRKFGEVISVITAMTLRDIINMYDKQENLRRHVSVIKTLLEIEERKIESCNTESDESFPKSARGTVQNQIDKCREKRRESSGRLSRKQKGG